MFITHVFLFPVLLATLIAIHLALVMARHHTQFRESRGTPNAGSSAFRCSRARRRVRWR